MTHEPDAKSPQAAAIGALVIMAPSSDTQRSHLEGLNIEIKKTWNRLSDDEINLQADNLDLFFAAIKATYGTPEDESSRRLAEIKASCSIGMSAR